MGKRASLSMVSAAGAECELLCGFIHSSLEPTVVCIDGRIQALNPAFLQLIQIQDKEWIGREFRHLLARDMRQRFRKSAPWVPVHFARKLGWSSEAWIKTTVVRESPLVAVHAFRVGAERQLAAPKAELTPSEIAGEHEHHAKEVQLKVLLEQFPVVLYTVDANLTIISSWGSALGHQNLAPNQLVGLNLIDCIRHNDPDQLVESSHRQVLTGKPVNYFKEWYGRFFDVSLEPIYNENKKVVGAVGLCVDVTDRRHVENALRESESRLKAILDNTTAIIWIKDRSGRYIHVNRRFSELLGKKEEDLYHQRAAQIFSKEAASRFEENDKLVYETGKLHQFEESLLLHGKLRTYISVKFPLFNSIGKVYAICGMATDISERKEVEAFLTAAKQAAENANRAKTEFLANMSHEIRTPIGAILGFAEILRSSDLSPEMQTECLNKISRNGKHLMELINDVLDLSKVEAGELRVEHIPFNIRDQIASVMDAVRAQASAKGLALSVTYEDSFPDRVCSDPTRFRQILLNIISNAVKFTQSGSISVRARLKSGESAGARLVELIVADTGCGIPADRLQYLFRSFGQIDASITRTFGGTGLGLILSRKFARALGGDVTLISTSPNAGSEFSITIDPGTVLLLSEALIDSMCEKKRSESTWRTDMTLEGVVTLLVEDGEDNQALYRYLLEQVGGTVHLAKDGQEGIEMALRLKPDVILMDIQMPQIDGYEATQRLRQSGYRAPIIALTAHAMSDEREKCLQVGCSDYISKPVERARLLRTVWDWAHRSNIARSRRHLPQDSHVLI